MKLILMLLSLGFAEDKPQAPVIFTNQRPSCTLIDGKLVLSKKWPLGSWKECAHSILSAAQQLSLQRDHAAQQLNQCTQAIAAKTEKKK